MCLIWNIDTWSRPHADIQLGDIVSLTLAFNCSCNKLNNYMMLIICELETGN